MQIEQPHHAPHGFGEFARQYAMIVLSILTALALEHVAISVHDASTARAAKTRIEAELAQNATDLRTAATRNGKKTAEIRALLKDVIEQLKTPPTAPNGGPTPPPAIPNLDISLPSWQRSAWDCAIADQSASHLAPADLRRYSKIYTDATDVLGTWQLVMGGEWLTRASDLAIDDRLHTVDRRKLAETLVRFLLADQTVSTSQSDLAALIEAKPQSQ